MAAQPAGWYRAGATHLAERLPAESVDCIDAEAATMAAPLAADVVLRWLGG